jgi:hypothetical protein
MEATWFHVKQLDNLSGLVEIMCCQQTQQYNIRLLKNSSTFAFFSESMPAKTIQDQLHHSS